MRRLVALLIALAVLVPVLVSHAVEMDTYRDGRFVYQIPAGWIVGDVKEGYRYYYARDKGSPNGGMISAIAAYIGGEQSVHWSVYRALDTMASLASQADGFVAERYRQSLEVHGYQAFLYGYHTFKDRIVAEVSVFAMLAGTDMFYMTLTNPKSSAEQTRRMMRSLIWNVGYQAPKASSQTVDKAAEDEPFSVLSARWQEGSLEELQAAQLELAQRIGELQAAKAPPSRVIEISGKGTTIKTGLEVDFAPSRVTFVGNGEISLTGGKYDYRMESRTGIMTGLMDERGSLTALVEASGDWSLSIEAIRPGSSLPIAGTGPYVGDFFLLTAPMIVTIKADAKELTDSSTNFIVEFCHQYSNISAWSSNSVTNEILRRGDTFEVDVIIKPEKGRDEYLFTVYCQDGLEWSITPKL